MSELIKHECGLLVHPAHQWQGDEFGHDVQAKGDMISNTIYDILERFQQGIPLTAWDYAAIQICFFLLIEGKRWPDEFNSEYDAKNWFEYQWSKFKYDRGWTKQRLYRSQRSMTRDPITYTLSACKLLGLQKLVNGLTVPPHLLRPTIFFWRRYIRTDSEVLKRYWITNNRLWNWYRRENKKLCAWLYEKSELLQLGLPRRQYGYRLIYHRALAAGNEKIMSKVKPMMKPHDGHWD